MKHIEVVVAIIVKNGKVFATQRGYGDFKDGWELPGGKIGPGETREAALVREIREELDTEIMIDSFLGTVEHDYLQFHITMHCFLCQVKSGKLRLKEHEDARWLTQETFDSVDWLPADIGILNTVKAQMQW